MSDELAALANDESYFGDEYLGYSIGTGIFWVIGMITPISMMYGWLMPESFYQTVEIIGIQKNMYIAFNYISHVCNNDETEFIFIFFMIKINKNDVVHEKP